MNQIVYKKYQKLKYMYLDGTTKTRD